jgi:hypothetical protein
VACAFAQRGEAGLGLIVGDDPRCVAADGYNARPAESVVAHAKVRSTVIVARTVLLADPLARANVVEALGGPGGPVGVINVVDEAGVVTVRFDDAVTEPDVIDDLVAIESIFVPARIAHEFTVDEATAIAAAGLGDPELDATRAIETYLADSPAGNRA